LDVLYNYLLYLISILQCASLLYPTLSVSNVLCITVSDHVLYVQCVSPKPVDLVLCFMYCAVFLLYLINGSVILCPVPDPVLYVMYCVCPVPDPVLFVSTVYLLYLVLYVLYCVLLYLSLSCMYCAMCCT
jgi:hypothetical protein